MRDRSAGAVLHWATARETPTWTAVAHRPAYDRVYLDALDINYAATAAQWTLSPRGCARARHG